MRTCQEAFKGVTGTIENVCTCGSEGGAAASSTPVSCGSGTRLIRR